MSSTPAPTFFGLPARARIYLLTVFLLAGGAVALALASAPVRELDPLLLIVLALFCATGNLFEVFAPANFSFQPNVVVFFAAALLMPPEAVAVLAALCYVPGWLVHRFPWYMVVFNVGNYILAAMAALAFSSLGSTLGSNWTPGLWDTAVLAGAAVIFVAVNHALIIGVVHFARGRSLRKSVKDMGAVVPIDLALAVSGACLVALWTASQPLALLAAGPMVLVYHALWVPVLRHKSRTDPKTGLFNSEYFNNSLDDALRTARQNGRPLTVVMIDLDQLRQANNRYGHLVGDRLILAVAEAVLEVASEAEGIAARFGGDELCLLLPEMPLREGREVAERMRAGIEAIELRVQNGERLAVTISAGVASYPEHADTVEGLVRAADEAVYDAKLGGRNRIRAALPSAIQNSLEPEGRVGGAGERTAELPLPARTDTVPTWREPPPALSQELELDLDWTGAERRTPPPDALADAPAENVPAGEGAVDAAEAPVPSTRKLIPGYIGILCIATGLIALFADRGAIADAPVLFVLLLASMLLLDAARIDVFERANLSPASVPELALAFFVGPLGPIVAELLIAIARWTRHDPVIKWSFDFGALSLSGAAAAMVFTLVDAPTNGLLIGTAALAGLAFYAVNSSLLALVMSLAEGSNPIAVWRERCAWMVPHYVVFGLLAGTFIVCEQVLGLYAFAIFGLPLLMLWIAEKQYLDRSKSSVIELRSKYDELEKANVRLRSLLGENEELLGRMHRSYLSTITSLARTVEAKDPYTAGHTERVADIAMELARELGFDESQIPTVNVGAIIHDIGKIGIADQILLKPGPLDPEEFKEMRRHPEISSYIVAELELPPIVKQMVRSHHERYDGAGYPDGLTGEEIPLSARILSVADALDAMTSDRPYRKALPLDIALGEIRKQAGTRGWTARSTEAPSCRSSSAGTSRPSRWRIRFPTRR
jgi:diguanylate cyclase (GGDEF)-like protein/putative nucleotidyltransferase with HDIG domain